MNSSEYILGIDVGGTKILAGLVDKTGSVLTQNIYSMNASEQKSIESSIQYAVHDFISRLSQPPSLMGIGLVGAVDTENGIWVGAINIPVKESIPMAERFYTKYGFQVRLDNDVHCAALAEAKFGEHRDSKLFVYLNIGTGISLAIIHQGMVIHGAGNYAGEIGHMVVDETPNICKCGRRGCIEPYVSGGGLRSRALEIAEKHPQSIFAAQVMRQDFTAGLLYQMANDGDPHASMLVSKSREMLLNASVNLVNLINPEWIVFGGGALDREWLLGDYLRLLKKKSLPASSASLRGISFSTLDPRQVGMVGAASLWID